MIRRLITEAIESVTEATLPPMSPRGFDLRDVTRTTPVRRPRSTPAGEQVAEDRSRREPEPLETAPQTTGADLGLGSRAELRRAFLLLEILGPPVALREPRALRERDSGAIRPIGSEPNASPSAGTDEPDER